MIMTQEQAFLKAQGQLADLIAFVKEASPQGRRLDQVERGLFDRLLRLGHSLLSAPVAAQGDGAVGATATPPTARPAAACPSPTTAPTAPSSGR